MQTSRFPAAADAAPNPQLDHLLRNVIGVGVVMVLLFPFARGQLPWLGWAPLWLVGMPLVAWCALHRFRLPARVRGTARPRRSRPQRVQARRRTRVVVRARAA